MNTQNTIPISEARKRIFDIAEEVQTPGVYYTLTANGRPSAVVLSAEEFDSWLETMHVKREFPNLAKDIADARRDYKAGRYITLDDLLIKEGFILPNNKKKKYAIPGDHSKKRSKGSRYNR